MSNIKKSILTISAFLLIFTFNYIKSEISSSKIDTITTSQISNLPVNGQSRIQKEEGENAPKPILAPQDKLHIQSWGSYMSEVAIASTVVVGSAALFASGGGAIGAGYGCYYGTIGASALSAASLTGMVGAGCGLRVAFNNFNLDEKSTYSRLAYQAGIATFVGAALGASSAGLAAAFMSPTATSTVPTAVAIGTLTGMDIATAVSITTALGYFFPTLVQEVKSANLTE